MEKRVSTFLPILVSPLQDGLSTNHRYQPCHAVIVVMITTFDSNALEMSFLRPMLVKLTQQSNIALVS